MKKLLISLTAALFLSCEEPKQVYETEIKTYTISNKESFYVRPTTYYILYFQTPTSTEKAEVTQKSFDKYKKGDTLTVLIKYWEKPKKK